MAIPIPNFTCFILALLSLSFSFSFSFSLYVATSLPDPDPDPDPCAGRRIHILPLPPRFNSDLLLTCNASFLDLSDSPPFCNFLQNHFLGPRISDRHPFPCWHNTDPRLLEPFFHHRLLSSYPCLTSSPSHADAIFLPYYASLDALPFLYSPPLFNSSSLHGVPLYQYLRANHPRVLSRHHGHDIFLLLAGVAWDYNQNPWPDRGSWGTSFLRLPQFLNFTILTLESRPWPWQEHAIPHMTSFHPSSLPRLNDWLFRAARSKRTALMLFAGGGAKLGATPSSRPTIRSTIISQCANRTDICTLLDCSAGACTQDPILSLVPMLKSKFCLHPPGDTPTRRSSFSSIIAGCIPVFFEGTSAKKQYGWHLPRSRYDEFSVYISKEDVVFGGLSIADVLEAIPEEKVRRMREKVLEMAPRVLYMDRGGGEDFKGVKDAFDLAIDGVFRRIQKRFQAIESGDSNQICLIDDNEEDDQRAFGF